MSRDFALDSSKEEASLHCWMKLLYCDRIFPLKDSIRCILFLTVVCCLFLRSSVARRRRESIRCNSNTQSFWLFQQPLRAHAVRTPLCSLRCRRVHLAPPLDSASAQHDCYFYTITVCLVFLFLLLQKGRRNAGGIPESVWRAAMNLNEFVVLPNSKAKSVKLNARWEETRALIPLCALVERPISSRPIFPFCRHLDFW